jgi:uncharacterized membrane protein
MNEDNNILAPSDEKEPDKTKPRIQRWKESYREWKEFKEIDKVQLLKSAPISRILARFALPFVLALEFSLVLYLLYPDKLGDLGKLFVFYFFNPAGMEVGVLYGFEFTTLNQYLVVVFMLVIDSLTAMFLIWNFNFSRLLPGVGWLVWVVQAIAEKKIKKSKSFDQRRFIALIIFVMIPAYGTGAILGGIVGKLLRMNPWKHWLAIFIGSSLRLTLMAVIIYYALIIFNYYF